jgi:ELWxxDGT repeat protein
MHLLGPVGDSVVLAIRSFTESSEELWRSDGTEAGTVRVRDFPRHPWAGSPTSAAFDGGILLSEIGDLDHGMELWRTDGTDEGTALVQDLAPGPAWSSPQGFVRFGSRILFMADDPIANVEPFAGRAAILLGQPQRAILDLRDELHALGLSHGIETSLVAKLNAAERALQDGRGTEAVLAIENFIRLAQARFSGRIDAAEAADLIEFAEDLLNLLAP